MATKLTLSREYLYCPLANLNFDPAELDVHRVAFKDDPGTEPDEEDWLVAIVVDNDEHPLWRPDIGPALVILVGPARGDTVTTEDLAPGDYQVWLEVSTPDSDERPVRRPGTLTVTATGQ